MKENNKTIGEKIREYRLEKGLTQDALATELHVSPQAISKWETGQTMPDINMLVPLSKVLGIGVNDLLGGDRRAEFERKFQQMIPFCEELTLLVAEDALQEFPDDETFLYRRACDYYFIGKRQKNTSGNRNYSMERAVFYFGELHHRYPEDDSYTSWLAEVNFELGHRDRALDLAYTIKDKKVRDRYVAEFLGGDEKIRYEQKKVMDHFDGLYNKLLQYNTRESINAAYALLDTLMPEDKNLEWFLFYKDACLCLDEGNVDGYLEKYRKAYEAARAYDALPQKPKSYTDPLFDRLTRLSWEQEKLPEFISAVAGVDKMAHPSSLELRREIVRDNIICARLFPSDWKKYFRFCWDYVCHDSYRNFGMRWYISHDEEDEIFDYLIIKYKKEHGSELLVKIWKDEIEHFIGDGIVKGTLAHHKGKIFGCCHWGEKGSFKYIGIPEEERAVPTAPEGSKIISIVEIMVANNLIGCGIEEKLLERTLDDAKRCYGFTHAEVYPHERMLDIFEKKHFDEMLALYEKLGFKIVRDLSNEKDGRYYIMQKEL